MYKRILLVTPHPPRRLGAVRKSSDSGGRKSAAKNLRTGAPSPRRSVLLRARQRGTRLLTRLLQTAAGSAKRLFAGFPEKLGRGRLGVLSFTVWPGIQPNGRGSLLAVTNAGLWCSRGATEGRRSPGPSQISRGVT